MKSSWSVPQLNPRVLLPQNNMKIRARFKTLRLSSTSAEGVLPPRSTTQTKLNTPDQMKHPTLS